MKKLAIFIINLAWIFLVLSPVSARTYYRTYEVVEVTETKIVLQYHDEKKIEIDRSRRPYLKKGDKVRYDKTRDRLRKTISRESDPACDEDKGKKMEQDKQ